MTTSERCLRVARAGWAAAAIATVIAACGQKGPLILPGEAIEPPETQIGGEADDGEEQQDDD